MSDWIARTVETLGYPGIALLMFLETVFPPIPSEFIMPLAGFAAAQGRLGLAGAILAGTLGSVLGALALYGLARAVGKVRLARFADRYGRALGVRGAEVERADAWFERRGPLAVLVLRVVPGLRSLVSLPAGVSGMALPLFVVLTAFGTAAWSALLTAAGYVLGAQYPLVERWLGPVGPVVFVGLLLAVVAWALLRRGGRGDAA